MAKQINVIVCVQWICSIFFSPHEMFANWSKIQINWLYCNDGGAVELVWSCDCVNGIIVLWRARKNNKWPWSCAKKTSTPSLYNYTYQLVIVCVCVCVTHFPPTQVALSVRRMQVYNLFSKMLYDFDFGKIIFLLNRFGSALE